MPRLWAAVVFVNDDGDLGARARFSHRGNSFEDSLFWIIEREGELPSFSPNSAVPLPRAAHHTPIIRGNITFAAPGILRLGDVLTDRPRRVMPKD